MCGCEARANSSTTITDVHPSPYVHTGCGLDRQRCHTTVAKKEMGNVKMYSVCIRKAVTFVVEPCNAAVQAVTTPHMYMLH